MAVKEPATVPGSLGSRVVPHSHVETAVAFRALGGGQWGSGAGSWAGQSPQGTCLKGHLCFHIGEVSLRQAARLELSE